MGGRSDEAPSPIDQKAQPAESVDDIHNDRGRLASCRAAQLNRSTSPPEME